MCHFLVEKFGASFIYARFSLGRCRLRVGVVVAAGWRAKFDICTHANDGRAFTPPPPTVRVRKKKNRKYSITRPPPREDETFLAVLKRCHAWRGRRHQRKKKWEAKIQDEGVWVMARKFPYSSNKTTLRKGAAAATEGHEICTKTCASFFLKTGRKLAVCERCFFWENASGKMAVLILGV